MLKQLLLFDEEDDFTEEPELEESESEESDEH